MARIIYGIAGEGMGHAIRSEVIIKHLRKRHKVKVVCGDSAYKFLSKKMKNVEKIHALRLMYMRNKVANIKTIAYNLKNLRKGRSISIKKIESLIKNFKPHIIISDFEYFTSHLAAKYKIPLIIMDNNHILSKTKLEVQKRYSKDYLIGKIVANAITRKADYFLLTNFFYPKTKGKNVYLFPPILRDKILALKPSTKKYILVYQTSKSYTKLIPALKNINENFIVYSIKKGGKEDNITYKAFNEKEFFNDLKNCKAVITNGGFSLIGEALYLEKPILSVPIGRQFEQIANALYIKKLGYGLFAKRINKNVMKRFLLNIKIYRKNLKKYKKEDNSKLFKKLDDIIKLKSSN